MFAVASGKLHPGQGELALGQIGAADAGGPSAPAVITGKASGLLWQVLRTGYSQLGFDGIEDDAFVQLVLARIVEPTSKADSLRVLDELGIAHASLRTIFRSLRRAQDHGYRAKCQWPSGSPRWWPGKVPTLAE